MPRRPWPFTGTVGIALLMLVLGAHPAMSRTADICRAAAERAAAESGAPFAVLWAITQTETGRNQGGDIVPWPWTLNVEGQGYWLNTRAAALERAQQSVARNIQSVDLGCFQINYRWHRQHFASLDQMLDPDRGAIYAAQFLKQLFDETGDWSEAAGAYHSRTPAFAARYRARFDQFYASANANAPLPVLIARENTFPLLQRGSGQSVMGSLVPILMGADQ